jgi:hypothetical protein
MKEELALLRRLIGLGLTDPEISFSKLSINGVEVKVSARRIEKSTGPIFVTFSTVVPIFPSEHEFEGRGTREELYRIAGDKIEGELSRVQTKFDLNPEAQTFFICQNCGDSCLLHK